jgi:PAS domain S-box-containing protein
MSQTTTSAPPDTDRYFRVLLDSSRDYALVLLDSQGLITASTGGAEKLKGYRADEIIGKHFSLFYSPEDVERGRPAYDLKTAVAEGRCEDEGWRLRKDGSRFWANVVITALRDDSGKVIGFGKITRDITDRKRVVDELARTREELEKRVRDRTEDLRRSAEAMQAELTARKQAEESFRALSTPVLPVRERLLIVPLIGVIDSARALQLTEQLLTSIRTYRARAIVMDITGVPLVDSRVANHLLQTVEAARLMGATVIVTGISPEISQTLVRIGVDLSRVRTMGDLRGGLEEAETLLGYTTSLTDTRG